MTKLYEWSNDKEGLISKIFDKIEYEFDGVNVSEMDATFMFLYGDREVPRKMNHLSVDEVATMIFTMFNHKWTNEYELLYNEIVHGVSSQVTRTNENQTDNNRLMERKTANNTSAFNDVDYVPDTENDETLSDDNKQKNSGTDQTETKSLWAIQQQLYMVNNNFIKTVLHDVANQTTLKIY